MLYVIGLGNPEEQYHDTPHNIGWEMIEQLVSVSTNFDDLVRNTNAMISKGMIENEQITLVKPLTYMNKSGEVLRMFSDVSPEQVVVIYDDIDLPFGTIKISRNRGDGGHNGIKSIEQHLGSRAFIRFRVGVCHTDWFGNARKPKGKTAVSNYLVHRKLGRRFRGQYKELAQKIEININSLIKHGYEKTVSQQIK